MPRLCVCGDPGRRVECRCERACGNRSPTCHHGNVETRKTLYHRVIVVVHLKAHGLSTMTGQGWLDLKYCRKTHKWKSINARHSYGTHSACLPPPSRWLRQQNTTHTWSMMGVVVRYIVTSLLLSHISLQGGGRLYRWEQSNLHQMSTPSCPFLLTLSGQLTGGQRIRVCAGSESS